MGEVTMIICNYCRLRSYRKKAKRVERKITTRDSSFMGGKDVYMHPHDVKIPSGYKHIPDSEEGFDKYWVCWMYEIPKFCEC